MFYKVLCACWRVRYLFNTTGSRVVPSSHFSTCSARSDSSLFDSHFNALSKLQRPLSTPVPVQHVLLQCLVKTCLKLKLWWQFKITVPVWQGLLCSACLTFQQFYFNASLINTLKRALNSSTYLAPQCLFNRVWCSLVQCLPLTAYPVQQACFSVCLISTSTSVKNSNASLTLLCMFNEVCSRTSLTDIPEPVSRQRESRLFKKKSYYYYL